MSEELTKVCIVVLGDIGRSPRMQYHSKSLADHGHKVDIVCYQETKPINSLINQPHVSFHYLLPYTNIPLPRILNYIFKTLWQLVSLMFVLSIIRKPNVLLVQNPPAVPALIVCLFYCKVMGVKYIVDWHNYAFSIMALNTNKNHMFVNITKKIEMFVGKRAAYNFCVTKEMQKDLLHNWDIRATTLYDRPPDIFKPITINQKHDLLIRLSDIYQEFKGENSECTVLTKIHNDNVILKSNRPGIIISSTSWTDDEDFSLLFDTLKEYDKHIKNSNKKNLPKLICIITGKGPLKEFYCNEIQRENWKNVTFITPWLEPEDYPLLLASADLGVSLHTSSSGLDLPMKVVDMFGCGLPVCAHDFRCVSELVKHQENGFVFHNAKELNEQLQDWFSNFPNNMEQIELNNKFKKNLKSYQELRWKQNWDLVAYNTFC